MYTRVISTTLMIVFSGVIIFGQNTITETLSTDLPSAFDEYDPVCGSNGKISLVLPEGPYYDIESITFEYKFEAKLPYAPVTQRSQVYFENLNLSTPIYEGSNATPGAIELYQEVGYTGFNGSFCGGDTLTFQLRLWRLDGFEGCGYDQYILPNTFSVKLSFSDVYAKKVKVGDNTKSVMLEVNGNMKLGNIPGLNEAGIMVYDSASNDFLGYDGANWKSFSMVSQIKDQDEDTRIGVEENPDEDRIKMIVDDTLYFDFHKGRINVLNSNNSVFLGNQAGLSESGSMMGNVAIGDSALMSNLDRAGNVAMGFKALKNNASNPINPIDGTDNTAIGYQSLMSNDQGTKNTAVGYQSLHSNTSGNFNIGIGASALNDNTTGYENIGIGFVALNKNDSGHQNIGIGRGSIGNNTIGNNNLGIGYFSLHSNVSGNQNIAIGRLALEKSVIQSANIGIGDGALQNNGDGINDALLAVRNTAVGHMSQNAVVFGNDNTSLGHQTLMDNTGYQNTAVGSTSLENNVGAFDNTAVGYASLQSNVTGIRNTAVGSKALQNSSASSNSAFGNESLKTLTTGSFNTAIGTRSMAEANNFQYGASLGANTLTYNEGNYNTAIGYGALFLNETGFENSYIGSNSGSGNISGSRNVALGVQALFSNSSTSELTAIGYNSLKENTSGEGNTGLGYSTLTDNQTGNHNTAVGHTSQFNTTGSGNTSLGYQSLHTNTVGNDNTAIGTNALLSNTEGYDNVSIGSNSMEDNTSGYFNVAVGESALSNITSGEGNVAIGERAFTNSGIFDVCTSVGHLADGGHFNSVSLGYATSLTADNQVRFGNSFTTSIGGYANWSNISDKRFKKDVEANVPGLDFIRKLNPVTYTYNYEAIKQHHIQNGLVYPDQSKFNFSTTGAILTGFLAQDVMIAAEELNFDFSGVDIPKNEEGYFGLRYSEFVVPLVKAVQEMDEKITTQGNIIQQLIDQNKLLVERIEALEEELTNK